VWVITGGAGYIGSHIAYDFLSEGKSVVVVDSLCNGLESRVEYLRAKYGSKISLHKGDIRDHALMSSIISKQKIDGIVHSAALKSVSESIRYPDEYMDVNFRATKTLLEIASDNRIKNFIFSSTAAVYGSPDKSEPVSEDQELMPISPYGKSKLLAEIEVSKFVNEKENNGASLRFFNVIGTKSVELKDNSMENLIPILIDKFEKGESPTVFGSDYPTPDGTCVRDYVDVRDVARAHLYFSNFSEKLPPAINIGTGQGVSVREVIALIGKFFNNREIKYETSGRRIGDPASLCANINLASNVLGFTAKFEINESLNSLFY